MSTEKHVGPTPAPWIVDEVNTPNGVSYEINHLWDDGEGTTRTDTVAEVVMDYRDDRALCNARLLAASPELLACLKDAIADCRCTTLERDSGHRVDCWVPTANGIVAKAEGK